MSDPEDQSVIGRHKKEKKDLQAKIQGLKKAKVDKKRKKEILDEITQLEEELEKRHAAELSNLGNLKIEDETSSVVAATTEDEPKKERLSKAQRRRERKSQTEKERNAQIEAEEVLAKDHPRQNEIKKIKELLKARNLAIFTISSDGDCLYNSVLHQLSKIGNYSYSTLRLRQMTAKYIEENKDNIIFYMTNPDTDDILNDDEFIKYCEAVRNTKAWGGEIEIKALSHQLGSRIEVIQATGPPTVHGECELNEQNLVITYHRHMYSLGEHYNSTQALEDANANEEEEPNKVM